MKLRNTLIKTFSLVFAVCTAFAIATMPSPAKAETANFSMVQGASIRNEQDGIMGLKFQSTVNASWLTENNAEKYTFGTLIYPASNNQAFDSEETLENNIENLDAVSIIHIENAKITAGTTFNASIVYDENVVKEVVEQKGLEITEELVNELLHKLYNKDFTARSYAIVGEEVIYTDAYTTSMYKTAIKTYEKGVEEENEVYKTLALNYFDSVSSLTAKVHVNDGVMVFNSSIQPEFSSSVKVILNDKTLVNGDDYNVSLDGNISIINSSKYLSNDSVCYVIDEEVLYIVKVNSHYFVNGICKECNLSVLELDYIHATPENQGVKNTIERAHLLTDVEWTTLGNVPGLRKNGEVIYFEEGVTYKGIPYSGVIANDCYVGLNVSLESYLTALKNPNSVLYTKNLQSTNSKAATYFGTVCSKFVQYALDLPGSYRSQDLDVAYGMETIALPGKYTVDQIKLGDVVLNPEVHTTICTDILYDEDGNVAYVEISEAVYPTTRRMLWSIEEFYEHFSTYGLYRYQYISTTPAIENVTVQDEYSLMPRFGNKYNYKVSNTKAVVDVLKSGYYKAVIKRDGVIVDNIVLDGATAFSFDCSTAGYIEMYLEKADGTKSESVYACVVNSYVKVTDVTSFSQGKLKVEFSGSSGTPLYVELLSQRVFCNIKGSENTAELSFKPSQITDSTVRLAYQNEYGIYLTEWTSYSTSSSPTDDPLLSQAIFLDGYNLDPNTYHVGITAGKEGYFTFDKIPVKANETYYAYGATRMWFLDSNGTSIETINASKQTVKYQFTTPARTAFMSISYPPSISKETLSIEVVHNYKNGVCLGCGESETTNN